MMGTGKAAAPSAGFEGFSLFAGGPLYRIALRRGMVQSEETLPRLGAAIALLTWVPLVVLTAVHQITLSGVAMPFLLSLGTHARFLVAIPLLFAAEAWAGPRLRHAFVEIVESRLVLPEEIHSLHTALAAAMRRRDSVIAEVALAALAIATMMAGVRIDVTGDVSAWRTAGGVLTPAGWWYTAISLPIFHFLCWRWCWRLFIWTSVLWRVSKLNLQLVPTHPDLCGGLGYLGVAQTHFGPLSLAISVVLAASVGEQILFTGGHLQAFLRLIVGIALINLLAFLGPLLFFTPRLLAVKRRGLREYGVLASTYTHLFDAKWVKSTRPAPEEALLGTQDIQALADLANGFAIIRHMRLVPFGPGIVLGLVTSAVAPMLPLLLFEFSPDELLLRLVRLLSGM